MFKNVLITIDLDNKEKHIAVLEAAKKYAEEGSKLYIISVLPSLDAGGIVSTFLPKNYDKKIVDKASEELHNFTKDKLPNIENVKHIVTHGRVYEKITLAAEKLDINLIITMASNSSNNNGGFGPNVARVARNSNCSVLILR